MQRYFILIISFVGLVSEVLAQENKVNPIFKNQVSNNTSYLFLGSLNLNFERVLGKRFAIGIGGTTYGNSHQNADLQTISYYDYVTNYEITPYARLYFNGTQKRSHFLELFGSINESEESDQFIRTNNLVGYGVYNRGSKTSINAGLGVGYGYRFLLAKNRLLLEAQIGLRTNFEAVYILPDGALVRTGIRLGYRF